MFGSQGVTAWPVETNNAERELFQTKSPTVS
jgi:hypothetical protein